MSRLLQDLRYALRTFTRGRFVTVLAVLAFALGIGVTTAVFSIFNGVLLKPLPYPAPEELVAVYDTQPACTACPASFPKYLDWKERSQVFSAIGGATPVSFVLTGDGSAPERLSGQATTASFADVFRVQPALGRWYTPEEDRPGGRKVIVLSHGCWTRRFGARPDVIGDRLVLDGIAHEVIGVMPHGFGFRGAEAYLPLQRELDRASRSHFLQVYGRLGPGMTVERAAADVRALGHDLAREFAHNHGIDVRSYYEVVVGNVRTPLQVLLGAVFLVLLIACANVANLLLAAGLARRRELAIRLALGAGQGDLARQLIAEAVLLAAAGGMIGVLLASWAIRTFVALAADNLPRAAGVAIDGRVLAFTAVLSIVVGIVCGLWPLLKLRTRELATAVREGDTRTASGSGGRFGNGLVVAEIALAFALLVGSTLLVKNLMLLQRRETGIQTARVVGFDVALAGSGYGDDARVRGFYRDLHDRLRAVGGVEAVGVVSHLPMYRFGNNGELNIEGGNPWDARDAPLVENRWIAADYFGTMGIRLLRGRTFDDRDRAGTLQVAVINRAMAEKFWPGQDPLGKRVASGSGTNWWQVIGVIDNVRSYGLATNTPFEIYRSIEQQAYRSSTIVMRTRSEDPAAAVQAARQVVASLDPNLPITTIQTMEQVVSKSVGQPRLLSALSALFGALAGLLAMLGVYGVTAYTVRRQRREFGIRLALGADASAVQRLVLRRGTITAAAGIVLGALGGLALTRTLQAMLNDVKPTDPSAFAGTAAAVFLVSLAACYLPARMAGRVDPIVVLRDQ